MKRLILQHWDGPAGALERGSWQNIAAYAKAIGAEHRVLTGKPMGPLANSQMHKLYMLDPAFDAYDTVVMMDSDMFSAKRNRESIFEVPGIGVVTQLQEQIRGSLRRNMSPLFDGAGQADYYGGALYKMDRGEREQFRAELTPAIMRRFDEFRCCLDEGVMHYLATLTQTKGRGLPEGERWACSSFAVDVKKAKIVHIRRRWIAGKEERRPKLESFNRLVNRGVLKPWT